jgi:hypothetical protein
MSYAIARAQLVSIVEATAPTTLLLGLGDKFRHDARGDDAQPVGGRRRFWLRAVQGFRRGPSRLQVNEGMYDVELVVEYQAANDSGLLDSCMAEDFEAITAALMRDSNWNRPASTIRNVGAVDADVLFRAGLEDVEGGRRLRITFPLEVTL